MAIFLKANWENIIMANYEIDPVILYPFLPKGTELDLFNGKTYVSLVGFMFKNTQIFNLPIPFLGTFEEINLRFYVKRSEGSKIKRGVVFINETVPYKLVAWMANKLYKEHYTAIPTKHKINQNELSKDIQYQWFKNRVWHNIELKASLTNKNLAEGSLEQFIFEHYYGYTRVSNEKTEEYRLHHPSWKVNTVIESNITCDFKAMYGNEFEILNNKTPSSVFIAEGSKVEIEWKRNRLTF
jgi:uncharacterized protein